MEVNPKIMQRYPNLGMVAAVTFHEKFAPMLMAMCHLARIDKHISVDIDIEEPDTHVRADVVRDSDGSTVIINSFSLPVSEFLHALNEYRESGGELTSLKTSEASFEFIDGYIKIVKL